MKTNRQTLRKCLTAACLLLACTTAVQTMAAGYVKKAPYRYAENVLIRECYWPSGYIVCNSYGTAGCSFTYFTDGATSGTEMFIPVDSVYDFEVDGRYVYFCGKRSTELGPSGIMGYFRTDSLPNSTVYYFDLPWMERLRKLDIHWFDGKNRIAMIGDDIEGRSALLDMYYSSPFWQLNYGLIDTLYKCRFTDVAVTDSFVVATSAFTGNSTSWEILWFLKTSSGNDYSLLNGQKYIYNTGYTSDGTFLMDNCPGTGFATVSRDATQTINTLHVFSGRTHLATSSFGGSASVLKDIKQTGSYVTVLINTPSSTFSKSQIFIFSPYSFLSLYKGLTYNGAFFTTLHRTGDHILIAGEGLANDDRLYIGKFNPSGLEDICFNTLIPFPNNSQCTLTPVTIPLLTSTSLMLPQIMSTTTGSIILTTICTNAKNDQ